MTNENIDTLLNDYDEDFQSFMERKNTLIGNISKLASTKFEKNKKKSDQYINKVQQIFHEEEQSFKLLKKATF